MNVAVFGATGKTGSRLVAEALRRGWSCRALVKQGLGRCPPTVWAKEGDARSLADVRETLRGTHAVFCCLGMADITVPATDFSDSVKTIVAAMKAEGVRRIIAIASAGVLPHPDGGYRSDHGLPAFLKNIGAEHVRNYETLRGSGLDWTLMCALTLYEDIAPGRVEIAYDDLPPGSDATGYDDLALTMVDLVGRTESFGRRVGIVSKR